MQTQRTSPACNDERNLLKEKARRKTIAEITKISLILQQVAYKISCLISVFL
jgi:hypothetical protein